MKIARLTLALFLFSAKVFAVTPSVALRADERYRQDGPLPVTVVISNRGRDQLLVDRIFSTDGTIIRPVTVLSFEIFRSDGSRVPTAQVQAPDWMLGIPADWVLLGHDQFFGQEIDLHSEDWQVRLPPGSYRMRVNARFTMHELLNYSMQAKSTVAAARHISVAELDQQASGGTTSSNFVSFVILPPADQSVVTALVLTSAVGCGLILFIALSAFAWVVRMSRVMHSGPILLAASLLVVVVSPTLVDSVIQARNAEISVRIDRWFLDPGVVVLWGPGIVAAVLAWWIVSRRRQDPRLP